MYFKDFSKRGAISPLKNDCELQGEANASIFDIVRFYIQIILRNDMKKDAILEQIFIKKHKITKPQYISSLVAL